MKQFGYLDREFINLYSDDNPVLELNDQCYCLITNSIDYHRPLICKGLIIDKIFTSGMNVEYFIKILEIIEIPRVIQEFTKNKQFFCYPFNNGKIGIKRTVLVTQIFDFESNVFPVEGFFVRNTLEKITELRTEYITIIKKDIEKQLSDILTILQ